MDISIHALLAESDAFGSSRLAPGAYFYPRSPCGERRVTVLGVQHRTGISIHALLAESDAYIPACVVGAPISIHALLAESDSIHTSLCCGCSDFYPRSPCGERPIGPLIFNVQPHFYPRSPCGERQSGRSDCGKNWRFLSTLSLRRATVVDTVKLADPVLFLSTLSLRRATAKNTSIAGLITSFLSTLSLRRATGNMKINGLMV